MRYKCPYCEATYGALFILKTHVRERHAKSCPVCGWRGKNLTSHLNRREDAPHLVYCYLIVHRRSANRMPHIAANEDKILGVLMA